MNITLPQYLRDGKYIFFLLSGMMHWWAVGAQCWRLLFFLLLEISISDFSLSLDFATLLIMIFPTVLPSPNYYIHSISVVVSTLSNTSDIVNELM